MSENERKVDSVKQRKEMNECGRSKTKRKDKNGGERSSLNGTVSSFSFLSFFQPSRPQPFLSNMLTTALPYVQYSATRWTSANNPRLLNKTPPSRKERL